MPYDVSVSSLVPPKFPDRCVLCGAAEPGRQVRFSAGTKYGAFFFVSWFGKSKGSILAPACGTCAVGAMSRALMRFALSAAGAALAAWFLFAAMKKGGRGLFKLKAIAVFFAAVIPAVVWDWLFPAKFSVTFNDENHTAVCHFYDPAYAVQFDALNHYDESENEEPPEDSSTGGVISPSHSPPATETFQSAASFEDKSNPYRNLEDPRFKK
jgi:hypothetical protein